jgi:hypothetical protein
MLQYNALSAGFPGHRLCCSDLPVVPLLPCRYKGIGQGIMLHYTCPGGNPAHTVLQMVSCCSNSPEALQLAADAWSTVSGVVHTVAEHGAH